MAGVPANKRPGLIIALAEMGASAGSPKEIMLMLMLS